MSVPAFCWRWSRFSWLFWIILKRPWPLYCLYSVWVCIWLTPGILNSYTFSLFYFSPSHLSHHHWSLISSFELLRMLRNSGEIDSKSGSSVLFSLVDAWNELSSSWSPGTCVFCLCWTCWGLWRRASWDVETSVWAIFLTRLVLSERCFHGLSWTVTVIRSYYHHLYHLPPPSTTLTLCTCYSEISLL